VLEKGKLIPKVLRAVGITYRNLPGFTPSWKMAKQGIATGLLCAVFSSTSLGQTHSAKSYITHYAPIAQSMQAKTGIPASVILGVAIIESGHGTSMNSLMLKNHFGIKGTNHLPSQGINYHSVYRSYSCDEASYGHFCTLIQRKKYYPMLKGSMDYQKWLLKINSGYYSEAGMIWVNKIKRAIEIYKLTQFDQKREQLACSPKMNWLHTI
jgi:Bax protein